MVNRRLLDSKMAAVGMNQQSLALAVGMSRSNLSAKMNGHFPFNVDEAIRICDALNIVDNDEKVNIFLPGASQ